MSIRPSAIARADESLVFACIDEDRGPSLREMAFRRNEGHQGGAMWKTPQAAKHFRFH